MTNQGKPSSRSQKPFKAALCLLLIFIWGCAGTGNQEKINASRARRNVGQAYLVQGNFTAALRELLQAEALNPNDPVLQNYLGLAFRGKERPNLAITHFDKALELMPSYASARNNLGETYLKLQAWDKAIAVFDVLSEDILYSTPHFADLNLGWAYFNTQNFTTAQAHYQKVLSFYQGGIPKDINYVKALRGLGRCAQTQGDWATAKNYFQKGLALAPNFVPLYLDMGRLWKAAGQPAKARESFVRVTTLAPDSDLGRQAETELMQLKTQP